MYIRKIHCRYQKYDDTTKRKAIELYEQGYGSTTIAHQLDVTNSEVNHWVVRYRHLGDKWLEKQRNTKATPWFREDLVRQVIEKCLSCEQVALENGVSLSAVKSWVQKVKINGYDSLYHIKSQGRPSKAMGRPKKKVPQSELEVLQERVKYLEAENALLKKVKALVEARDARLKEIGRKPSKN